MQGTINGYGERTGNCNLTSVIPVLQFKLKRSSVPAEALAVADRAVAVRGRARQPAAEPASAVGRRRGVLAQGRHARQRGVKGPEQLRAHRAGAGRQHPSRADQRSRRPQQHRAEGARARLRSVERYAGAEGDAGDDQGARAPRLRVRSRRRIAGAADSSRHEPCADAVHGRRVSRVDAIGGRGVGVRSDGQGTRRRRARAHGGRRRRPGQRARRRAARRAGRLLSAAAERFG